MGKQEFYLWWRWVFFNVLLFATPKQDFTDCDQVLSKC